MKILVVEDVSREGLALLEKHYTLEYYEELSKEKLISLIPSFDAILVRSKTKIDRDVLDAGKKLKVVGRAGVGVDNIDVDYATKKGIFVINSPTGNIVSAAEHTIAMLLALLRRIPSLDAHLKSKTWKKIQGEELRGKTVGIIGLGKIGRLVAKRLLSFDCTLIAYDPYVSSSTMELYGVKKVELKELLTTADVITLHVPLTDATRGMLSKKEFELMKSGVYLLNLSRGPVVDLPSLLPYLQSGKIRGAALDVFPIEPPPKDDIAWQIISLPNVIATPHVGGTTKDAERYAAIQVAEQIHNALSGKPCYALNMPICVEPTKLLEYQKHMELADLLAKLLIQIHPGAISSMEVRTFGISEPKLISLAAVKGALSHIISDVSYVNSLLHAENRGILVSESPFRGDIHYSNLIELHVIINGTSHTIAGSVFYGSDPRITFLEGYRFEMRPGNIMLITESRDVPGFIGRVGTLLGKNNINIAEFTLSRDRPGGTALSVITTDSDVGENILADLKRFPEVIRAHVVHV